MMPEVIVPEGSVLVDHGVDRARPRSRYAYAWLTVRHPGRDVLSIYFIQVPKKVLRSRQDYQPLPTIARLTGAASSWPAS